MKMKKWIAGIALGSMMLLAGCGGGSGSSGSAAGEGSAAAEANADALQIGIIQTQAHVALDRAREGFEDGLEEAGYTVGEDVVIDYQNAQGDQSNLNTITNQFASDKKDLVCARQLCRWPAPALIFQSSAPRSPIMKASALLKATTHLVEMSPVPAI